MQDTRTTDNQMKFIIVRISDQKVVAGFKGGYLKKPTFSNWKTKAQIFDESEFRLVRSLARYLGDKFFEVRQYEYAFK